MSVSALTLKQLRAILQVYRTGRISAAAEVLNVTQSAVSVLIRQSEEALGAHLFDRTTRSLAPTDAVEMIIGMVERILDDVGALEDTVSGLGDLTRGRIRLTTTPATGMTYLPSVVRRFRENYPGVNLMLDDCAPNQFFTNIRYERADFGIGTEPDDADIFDWRPLHDDPLQLICPDDHPFAARQSIAWGELHDMPLILSRSDYGVRNLVEKNLARLGVRLKLSAEVAFLGSAIWMTACGMGMGILPSRFASASRMNGVRALPLVDPVVTRPLGVVTHTARSLSPASKAFIEMMAEDVGQWVTGRS
ncbi:MAG: LysR family transcriptional regulator [Hoeflea sp.]|uniref:LysR family transcriptional regulator n=1 Tax=Hoeflea sp. TaxID=1940281 RepID=UPI000C0EC2B3|nr:LysR family transcriptional regulator [Hoeflea sp.]PHR19061.1 MAG: LysR family transcriptional regulator [Hoeflea sp.]